MSKVKMTVRQIKDLGLWDQVLEYKGWNPYICNEGLIGNDDEVEFDTEFKKRKMRKKLKVKMTMYIPMNEDEDEGDARDRLDKIAYDNSMSYQIHDTEVQNMED